LPSATIHAPKNKNISSITIIAVLLAVAGGVATTRALRHARRNIRNSRKIIFSDLAAFE
jgi:hypothetical protein